MIKQARNDSDVKSDAASMCTAFTDKDTNTQMYALTITGLRVEPCLRLVPHNPDQTC